MDSLTLKASKKTKSTPAGEIPVDWGSIHIQEIVPDNAPVVYGIVQAGPHVADGIPYIRSTDVGGKIDPDQLLRTSSEIARKYRRSTVIPGDIVFSLRGNIGESSLVPESLSGANLTQGTARIRTASKGDSRFFRYALMHDHALQRILAVAKGSTFREITLEDLRQISVPLPPLPEQRKIADILSTWDEALEKLDALIAAKERRKQALMQQLLTGKKRVKGATEKWKKLRFGDFLTESRIAGTDGASAKKVTIKLYGRGVHAKQDRLAGSENTKYYIRKAGQFIYSKLDFLNGAFGIIPDHLDGYESTLDLPSFDVAPSADARWLLYFVTRPEFYSQQLGAAAGGRKARRVNPSEFLAMKVLAPTATEQKQIATILDTADEELALLRRQRKTLDQQKRGLMQRLLTGKLRVSL